MRAKTVAKRTFITLRLVDMNVQDLMVEAKQYGYENVSSYIRANIRFGRAVHAQRKGR